MGRVVVVGSLHYDILIDTAAWPARGETLPAHGWRPKFGGKGRNQAVAARLAGASVDMVGRIGEDAFGLLLRDDLSRLGIGTTWLRTGSAPSGMSVAIGDAGGDYRAFIASGVNLELEPADVPAADSLRGAGAVVLQNEIPEATNVAAAVNAAEIDVPVILNAAPYRDMPESLLDATDILVLNAVEAAQMAGLPEPGTLDAALGIARTLVTKRPGILITVGSAGSAYADQRSSLAVPARSVVSRSSHGAGDAYVGTLAAAIADGKGIGDAMSAATLAAAEMIR